jgi:hypothetical protein
MLGEIHPCTIHQNDKYKSQLIALNPCKHQGSIIKKVLGAYLGP